MANSSIDRPKHPARTAKALCLKPLARLSALLRTSFLDGSHGWSSKKGGGAGNRVRNIMRIRNLTRTGIILALGTERLYLEPTRRSPAIVRWTQNTIGMRHIELGASYQCLQVSIHEDIAHVEGIPDPGFPSTLFLVDHHVFSNCDRPDVFTYNDEEDDGNGNVIIGHLVGK